jgi:hypothetical protein
LDLAEGGMGKEGRMKLSPPGPFEPESVEEAGLGAADGMLRVEQLVADLGGWNCRTIEAG